MKKLFVSLTVLMSQAAFAQPPIPTEKAKDPEQMTLVLTQAGQYVDRTKYHEDGTRTEQEWQVFRTKKGGAPYIQPYCKTLRLAKTWECHIYAYDAYGKQVAKHPISPDYYKELLDTVLSRVDEKSPVTVVVDLKNKKIKKISQAESLNNEYASQPAVKPASKAAN